MFRGKSFEVKRNHHYVMVDYLRRWSQDGKNIWYTTPSGKVGSDSIKGLAKEDYFYRASPLTKRQIQDFLLFFRSSPPSLREQHLQELEVYLKIQHLCQTPSMEGKEAEKNHAVSVLMCNTLENTHAFHEREARDIMKHLAKGEFSILEADENLMKFLVYFGHQIARTRAFKESCLLAMEAATSKDVDDHGVAERLRGAWWFFSYIFGMNIGRSLYLDRKTDKHCLLINDSNEDFITSNQPIINIHPDLKESDFHPPDDNACDFFYPISPKIAFMVNKSTVFPHGVTAVSGGFVQAVNQRIAKTSEHNIFATTKEQVRIYRKLVGQRMKAASIFYTSS